MGARLTTAGVCAALLAAFLGGGAIAPSRAEGARAAPEAAAKCKKVIRKVKGKRRTVRLCPKKINLTVRLDSSRTSSFTLTPAGGTASATGANGVKFTLSFPAGATAKPVSVRLTPVRSAVHLPLDSLIAAVQLEPEGTVLDRAATLTLKPPRKPSGRLMGFGYTRNGKAVHPYPATRKGGALSLTIGHFSGYGVGAGYGAHRAALVATMVAEWSSIYGDLSHAVFDTAYLADSGILWRYRQWKLAAEAYGFAELTPLLHQLTLRVRQAFEQSANRAGIRCRGSGEAAPRHELAPVYDVLRAIALARQLSLHEVLAALPPVEIELHDRLRFELDFETVVTWTVEGGFASSYVRVEQLELNWGNGFTNDAPLDYYQFEFPHGDCGQTIAIQPGDHFQSELPYAMKEVWLRIDDQSRIEPAQVDAGTAVETVTILCPDAPPWVQAMSLYTAGISALHGGNSFPIDQWSYVGESLFAQKDYNATITTGDGTISEVTSFRLRHTPAP